MFLHQIIHFLNIIFNLIQKINKFLYINLQLYDLIYILNYFLIYLVLV